MKIEILDVAKRDLIDGFHFYEKQGAGLGSHFLTNLYADIESLKLYGGIHSKPYKDYHRLLANRFPFAVFYRVEENTVRIHAVLDCRRSPTWIRRKLRNI
jgi:plasmid stabilization system protein ParE